jgi:hypothetical protein
MRDWPETERRETGTFSAIVSKVDPSGRETIKEEFNSEIFPTDCDSTSKAPREAKFARKTDDEMRPEVDCCNRRAPAEKSATLPAK